MSQRPLSLTLSLLLLVCLGACGGADHANQEATSGTSPQISGRIEAGLRVLTVDPAATDSTHFTIYRGDYVRLESTTAAPVTIVIPDLKVNKTFPAAVGEKAYFKVPQPGRYPYTIGRTNGVIEAIPYQAKGYREVSAAEGAELIRNISPFILDVRTNGEFSGGHLANAQLIPVQVLLQQLDQLADYKDKPVLVYCASGNRSTVAAKMLMDNGFQNVTNMNGGIKAWQRAGLPVTR